MTQDRLRIISPGPGIPSAIRPTGGVTNEVDCLGLAQARQGYGDQDRV